MLSIVFLVIGIVGFVKGKLAVSKTRELRGPPLYIVCTLLCLPLPLSFMAGLILGFTYAASNTPIPPSTITLLNVVFGLGPILVALIVGYTKAQPKVTEGPRGFDVPSSPPPPPRPPVG